MTSEKSYHNPALTWRPDLNQVRTHLLACTIPGQVFEIRVLNTRRMGPSRFWANTYSGFFDNVDDAVNAVRNITGGDAAGVYFTVNPLKRHVLNWNHNIIDTSLAAATDDDVEEITTLFLDIDPIRPRLTCSTDVEHDAAKLRCIDVVGFTTDLGWPKPAWVGSSGSGATAFWRVDMAGDSSFGVNEQAKLIEGCLKALDAIFTDGEVRIDTGVFNPARIARLAGTVNAKSPTPQPDRPWRRAKGKAAETTPVTRDQLERLAAMAPGPLRPTQSSAIAYASSPVSASLDIKALLTNANIAFTEHQRSYGTAFDLEQCLTSDQHSKGASFIQTDDGRVFYKCHHTSCKGRGWSDVSAQLGVKPPSVTTKPSRPHRQQFRAFKLDATGRVVI